MDSRISPPPAYWSFDGLLLGARLIAPVMPATIAFGIAVGSVSAGKGLTFIEQLIMSAVVYAGLAQMVSLEVWPGQMTVSAIAGLALVVGTVNARMLLLGAGLRPWFNTLPGWQVYPSLYFLTDIGWLTAMRYRADGGADAAVFIGGSLLIYLFWIAATSTGYLAGALVPDMRVVALDLVVPIFFSAMLVPLWSGARRAIPWLVAGAVSLAVYSFVDGWWYVIAGSLAGIVVAGFIDDD